MSLQSFDALSRRVSLLSLGAAGLATALPMVAEAKKKKKHKKKGDVNKLCKNQAADWTNLVTAECGTGPECPALLACAEPLRSCQFSSFIACFTAAAAAP